MTLAATVTPAGIVAPTHADILASLQDQFRTIYGADVYIAPDSQDGQFLALLATAIHDCNDAAVAVFNAFAPQYAQGTHLSALVKLNGLARLLPSYSSAVGLVVGQVGTVIKGGNVKDSNGNVWNLPAEVVIPPAGQINVTVTAAEAGALFAPAGQISKIGTPVRGWQSFVSTSDAVPGAPVESDAALRKRQARSTQQAAQGPLDALVGALTNLEGVTHLRVYENSTAAADPYGIPARSIAVVVEGGDASAIAQTIGQKKAPGPGTFGTTHVTYTDPVSGIPYAINFFVCDTAPILVKVGISGLDGFRAETVDDIKASIANHINAYAIGADVEFARMWAPIYLNGAPDSQTYRIDSIAIGTDPAALIAGNISIDYYARATCRVDDINITVA
jgi:uncharacterized phage protein gp47/JayE